MDPEFPGEATHVSVRRYIAHLADGVVFLIVFVLVVILAALVSDVVLAIALVLLLTVGQVVYYVLAHGHSGRSPGKRLVGLQVVDAHGRPPSTGALVKRSIPLLLEYFYIVAWISIITSDYRQRLGDRWAKTYVVDFSPPAAA